MAGEIVSALIALAGVAVGGGAKVIEARFASKRLANSTLSALVSEVEGLVRLARHRDFKGSLHAIADHCRTLVETGRGTDHVPFFSITMASEYFAIYKASLDKIGLLEPYQADRIVRFYLLASAGLENYQPGSPWQAGSSAAEVLAVIQNDLMIFEVVDTLGEHIMSFRTVARGKALGSGVDQPATAGRPLIGLSTADLLADLDRLPAGEDKARLMYEYEQRRLNRAIPD